MGDRIVSCSRGLVPVVLLAVGCVARLPGADEGESTGSTSDGSTSAEPSGSTSGEATTTGVDPSTTTASDDDSTTGVPEPPPPPGGLGPWGFGYVELPEIAADWIGFADLDGDGPVDVIARWTDDDGDFHLTTHRGLGDGSFVEVQDWYLPGNHGFLRAANFDGEPGPDVALFDGYGDDAFTLLRNDGRGQLTAPQSVQVGGFFGFGANPLRDDLDGDDDLFVPQGWGEGGTVAVAQGGGEFTLGAVVPSPACYFSSTAVADFDGDGLDEVVGVGSCNSVPEVLPFMVYRHVDGVLTEVQSIVADLGPTIEGCDLAVTDADGDGDLDVVTATLLGLYVLENEGDGVFADPPVVVPHTYPEYARYVIPIAIEDAPGSAFVLALRHWEMASSEPPALVVHDATWTSSASEVLDLQGRVAGSADVDGDGRPDVAVILGDGTGTLALWLSGG